MFVSRPNEAPREVELVSGRPHVTKGNNVWLLRLKEITDRDAAETLRNYKYASSSALQWGCSHGHLLDPVQQYHSANAAVEALRVLCS